MSAKHLPIRSKSSSDMRINQVMENMAKFYIRLPETILEDAMKELNRDARKELKKASTIEKKILIALKMDGANFTKSIYEYQCGSMLISSEASYEEIISSYNSENCIMNTILIFKKYRNCENGFDLKLIEIFTKSEQFKRTISDNYDENIVNDEPDEEVTETVEEEPAESDETVFLPETDMIPEEDIAVPEVSGEMSVIPETPVVPEVITIPETFSVPEVSAVVQTPAVPETPVVVKEENIINIPETVTEKIQSIVSKKKPKEKVTSYYIGNVEKHETYYNFAPHYKLDIGAGKKKLTALYPVRELFPPNGTVNLSYVRNGSSQSQRIIEGLDLQQTFAISFDRDSLEKNIDIKTGVMRTDVSYKIDLQMEFDMNRNATTFFRKISELKIFRIAEVEEFFDGTIVISDDFAKGEWVLVRCQGNVMDKPEISGPYRVYKDNEKTYIQPKLANERYMLTCYKEDELTFGVSERQEFDKDPVCIPFAVVEDGASYKKDVISDELLIKSMFTETSKDFLSLMKKSPDEFARMMISSQFLAKNIPDVIKAGRLARIRTLFSEIKNYTDEQKQIAKTFLRDYNSDDEMKELMTAVIKSSQEFKDLQKELEKKSKAVKPTKAETKALAEEFARAKAVAEKSKKIEELEQKIADLKEQYAIMGTYGDILKDIEYQKGIRSFLSEENSRLQHRNNEIKGKIKTTITEQANEVGIAFDPYISSAMLDAASQWNRKQETEVYSNAVSLVMQKKEECSHKTKSELITHLVGYVKKYRNYSTNDIINMYICITQGFLTVFSGLPGTGKTSVCNIIGNSLGLTDFGDGEINYNRFVPVSVEKGWSSKKDLIGYYNPLTKKYDKNNRRLYDTLMVLNEEKDNSPFPYIVLLDEANLSPMEYYWADFMQIADRSNAGDTYINIGLEDDIYIPETLRFVATINNDQTTETLSPRLLDRAWIIKLPDSDIIEEVPCPAEKVLWEDLSEAFNNVGDGEISPDCKSLLEQIFKVFQNYGMAVSPRIQLSMRRYIISAKYAMKGVNGVSSEIIAVDYAVMQRLLPKINGYMKLYKELFDKLINICSTNRLDMTKNALEEMKKNSSRNMGYCQYLS